MKIKKDGYIYDMVGMKPKQMAEIELALKDRLKQIKKQGKMEKSAETIKEILEYIKKKPERKVSMKKLFYLYKRINGKESIEIDRRERLDKKKQKNS